MTTTHKFLDACLDPAANCVTAVKAIVQHDPRMAAALTPPERVSPRDLIPVAAKRAARAGIKEHWPYEDELAVGFYADGRRACCAVHIPHCGWWAYVKGGAMPVPEVYIIVSYEVAQCPQ